MEGKLIKLEESKYTLVYKEGNIAWENNPAFDGKLSLKNCEAIANGYDLDELADIETGKYATLNPKSFKRGFLYGFQKALEILSDKKFGEDDIYNALDFARVSGKYRYEIMSDDDFIKSLKQTEWDVEIVMDAYYSEDFLNDGETHILDEKFRPRLDEDGCLILKRK